NFKQVSEMYLSGMSLRLSHVGELAATKMNDPAIESNKDENLPRLFRFDDFGNRVERIIFHPCYHDLGALVWNTGVLSVLRDSGNELLSGAMAYLMSQNG